MHNKFHEQKNLHVIELKTFALMSILLPWKMLFYKAEVLESVVNLNHG